MELAEILRECVPLSGKCYAGVVEIVNFPTAFQQLGASGPCPHCGNISYFKPVTSAYTEQHQTWQTMCNAVQCEACKKFALVEGNRNQSNGNVPFGLKAFYPLGRPRDGVDPSVPVPIADDFTEALRCRWIEAYKATVTMCRRAIQASCLEQKANKIKKLVAQIDELAAKGLITQSLKNFAHEIRLEGNDGAHPDPDGLENVTQKDADDIVEFTREYLNHVYVMPAKLAARRTAAPPATASAAT